jgi:hypothetical protein
VTLDDFLSLKPKLDLISGINYIHIAQERTLIITVSSDAHESVVATIRDLLHGAMDKQHALNPTLTDAWQLRTNRSAWFNNCQDNSYVSNMTLFSQPPQSCLHSALGCPPTQGQSHAHRP